MDGTGSCTGRNAPCGRRKVVRVALVTGDLQVGGTTGGEFHDVVVVGRVGEMVVLDARIA